MEWDDEGIILGVRVSGEHAGIVGVFTPQYGKWFGRVSGAQATKRKSWLEPGNSVTVHWGARLEEQLGNFRLEPSLPRSAGVFDEPKKLLALSYLSQLTDETVQERLPLPLLYDAYSRALDVVIENDDPRRAVIDYELKLLELLGYGLDLKYCAATGESDDLVYLSPNTGRAVSRAGGEPYAERLLPLPQYWLTLAFPDEAELKAAARVTGFFLTQHFFQEPRKLPGIRAQIF